MNTPREKPKTELLKMFSVSWQRKAAKDIEYAAMHTPSRPNVFHIPSNDVEADSEEEETPRKPSTFDKGLFSTPPDPTAHSAATASVAGSMFKPMEVDKPTYPASSSFDIQQELIRLENQSRDLQRQAEAQADFQSRSAEANANYQRKLDEKEAALRLKEKELAAAAETLKQQHQQQTEAMKQQSAAASSADVNGNTGGG